jgi:hypothetical protein
LNDEIASKILVDGPCGFGKECRGEFAGYLQLDVYLILGISGCLDPEEGRGLAQLGIVICNESFDSIEYGCREIVGFGLEFFLRICPGWTRLPP